jgi:hypothetical protein
MSFLFCCFGGGNRVAPAKNIVITPPQGEKITAPLLPVTKIAIEEIQEGVHHLELAKLEAQKELHQFRHLAICLSKQIFQEEGTIALIVNKSFTILAITQKALDILGLSKQQLIGQHISSIVTKIKGIDCSSTFGANELIASKPFNTRSATVIHRDPTGIARQFVSQLSLMQTQSSNYFLTVIKKAMEPSEPPKIPLFLEGIQDRKKSEDIEEMGEVAIVGLKIDEKSPQKEAHRQGLEGLAHAIKNSPPRSVHMLCDSPYSILAVTNNMMNETGFSAEEILGKNFFLFIWSDIGSEPDSSGAALLNDKCKLFRKGYNESGAQLYHEGSMKAVHLSESLSCYIVSFTFPEVKKSVSTPPGNSNDTSTVLSQSVPSKSPRDSESKKKGKSSDEKSDDKKSVSTERKGSLLVVSSKGSPVLSPRTSPLGNPRASPRGPSYQAKTASSEAKTAGKRDSVSRTAQRSMTGYGFTGKK